MKYIVVDLELLQPGNEIIDIGAVLYDTKRREVLSRFDSLANPGKLPDDYKLRNGQTITELTGITAEMIEEASPLHEVLLEWWAWVNSCQCGKRICTWGTGDLKLLADQSKQLHVHYPDRIRHMNLKIVAEMFRDPMRGAKAFGGLKRTMELFGLQFEGREHRALPDAENTAHLLGWFCKLVESGLFVKRTMGGW